jgi:hypothetical protein
MSPKLTFAYLAVVHYPKAFPPNHAAAFSTRLPIATEIASMFSGGAARTANFSRLGPHFLTEEHVSAAAAAAGGAKRFSIDFSAVGSRDRTSVAT